MGSSLPYSCPDGETGRRGGLKIRCPLGRAGSSPAPGTSPNPRLASVSALLSGDGCQSADDLVGLLFQLTPGEPVDHPTFGMGLVLFLPIPLK